MKVFSIADLHLSHSVPGKAMDKFGCRWKDHTAKLREGWLSAVGEGDLVLVNGDISWAMQLEDARQDLFFLHSLPGRKILLRGNHDYWWSSYSRVRSILPPSVDAVQNNVIKYKDIYIGGTRGWNMPGSSVFSEEEDRKIYEREKIRLGMSLSGFREGNVNLCMLHFPPFSEKSSGSEVTEMLESAPVTAAVYGHLHGVAGCGAFEGEKNGVRYVFTAADHLNFVPKLIMEV